MAEPTQTFGPWLKQKLVEAGEIAPDAKGVNLDPKVRDAYLRMWQNESKGGSNFTPTAGTATNAATGAVVDYFMSSPNSAQPMREAQPKQSLELGQDGNMYVVDPVKGLATVVTNAAGQPFGAKKKANAVEDLVEFMERNKTAAPAESGGFLRGLRDLFPGGAPTPSPTPMATPAATPMPTPMPTPMATPAATPMPAMAGTNAPAPALSTPEAVRAAFLAGQISEAQAVQMLRGGR